MKKVFLSTSAVLVASLRVSLFLTLVSPFAQAVTSSSLKPQAYYAIITQAAPYDDAWKKNFPAASAAAQEKSVKAMKTQEPQRKLASDMDQEFYESKMSVPMKKFRDDFLNVKTADDLDTFLLETDKKYDTYPGDVQFIAAQLLPLRVFRGIIWKLVPTVQDSNLAHSLILTQVKSVAVNMKVLLPTDQWQAGFDYVTQPFVENGVAPFLRKGQVVAPFARSNEADVQSYVRLAVIPALRQSAARLEKLDLSSDLAVWDNKLLYGTGSFPSAVDRYALFGEVERHAALSNIFAGLSELCYQSAYSLQGSLQLNQEIGKLYGWDGFLGKVDGVPAAKRIQVIRNPKFASWGRLFQDGTKWTSDAWFFLGRSVDHGEKMWNAMKDRPVSETFVVNNASALPFQRPIGNRFENLKRLLQGPAEIHSFVTDEKVVVNLEKYYLQPPSDLKRLYALPSSEDGPEMLALNLNVNGKPKSVPYRNFLYGRPTQWDLSVYQPYFPTVKTNQDLQRAARILSQGWGTSAIATPLMNYMN